MFPINAANGAEMIHKKLDEPLTFDSGAAASLPFSVTAILRKALSVVAADRYASAQELRAALIVARAETPAENAAATACLATKVLSFRDRAPAAPPFTGSAAIDASIVLERRRVPRGTLLDEAERVNSLIRSWLGVEDAESRSDAATLRDVLDALDKLEPERARYLARFAYLLGRVAHADQTVSPEETRTMERILEREGHLPSEQAVLVVGLAKTSNLLFGGTDNYVVAREFEAQATPAQKLELLRCLFAVSIADDGVSILEEREIQRIARELRIEAPDVVTLRLEFKDYLPGLKRSRS